LKYSIITPIKESNKGKVCLAKVEGYEFPVIVKELKHGNKAVFQALRALECAYLPKIYEVVETDKLLIVEEYIEGEILSDYLTSGKLTETDWLDIAWQLCEALRSLHEHVPPIIHRDIKPSNIILNSKGCIKIIDFDSSRLYKAESEGDTRLLGTERYAPPEQYGFSQTDCRSDIYSLGVVFGMFPAFSSKERQKRWKQLVEKCTLFAPESRFQTVEEVEKEVHKITRVRRIQFWRTGGMIAGIILIMLVACLLWRLVSSVPALTGNEIPTPTTAPIAGDEIPTLTPIADAEVTTPTNVPVTENEVPTPTVAPVTKDEVPPLTVAPATEDEVPPPTLAPEIEEANRTTPPEWRDIEGEIPAFVSLKEQIRNNHLTVDYCFKDRLSESGFLLQVKWLEQQEIEFRKVELYSHRDGMQVKVEETYYDVSGSIISFAKEYMQKLVDGYYTIVVSMHNTENEHDINHSAVLYVAEHDAWENRESWLQNTTMSFYGAEGECLHNVMMNESTNEIISLLHQDRTPVDSSLYRVTHGGRGIEFSNELLSQYGDREFVEFYVMGMDGTDMKVRIENYIQDKLQ